MLYYNNIFCQFFRFEAAIGVPVSYWDSSLDFHMRDPTRAVVWSPKYFGNGFGEVPLKTSELQWLAIIS